MLVKQYKFPVNRTSSGDLIFNMVTKVNNFVLHIYLKVTERVALKCSYHTKKIIIM